MHQDFKELLSAFNAGQVRYLIVGGYAVSFHAQPRATKALDIFIGADAENSKAVYAALAKFGAQIEGLSAQDFAEPDNFFRMGTPPVMVDIMPKISGVEFEDAWRESKQGQEFERQQRPAPSVSSARNELDEIKKEGREDWLRQQEQQGSSPTLEELRAKGREDWLKLREQQTRENSRDPQDRSAERDQDAEPKDLPGRPAKGLDDDLN